MDIKSVLGKVKRPWYVPGFVWNAAVNIACDKLHEVCRIEEGVNFASDRAVALLENAVADKDASKREKCCDAVAKASVTCQTAANALADGVITDAEKYEVREATKDFARSIVSQTDIDGFIDDVREALLA